jgi:hypothetical protein
MSTNFQPVEEMKVQALSSMEYASSYLRTFQRSLNAEKRRFDNDLLYNFAVMSFEKFFVALLARYDWNATSHLPLRLFKEAEEFDADLTDRMKQTAIFIGSFEGICSIDGFGYRTPALADLLLMESGLEEVSELVERRMAEISENSTLETV